MAAACLFMQPSGEYGSCLLAQMHSFASVMVMPDLIPKSNTHCMQNRWTGMFLLSQVLLFYKARLNLCRGVTCRSGKWSFILVVGWKYVFGFPQRQRVQPGSGGTLTVRSGLRVWLTVLHLGGQRRGLRGLILATAGHSYYCYYTGVSAACTCLSQTPSSPSTPQSNSWIYS